ncbi:MAG: hypothetical protein U5L06_12785 [Rhodovibrio sp.]|nr:hypothetical protein [Rhodovibrio sp.]
MAPVHRRQFLGYRLQRDGGRRRAPEAYRRAKAPAPGDHAAGGGACRCEPADGGGEQRYTSGWCSFPARPGSALAALDRWLRRRLRCFG